jgi:hypothetical protein
MIKLQPLLKASFMKKRILFINIRIFLAGSQTSSSVIESDDDEEYTTPSSSPLSPPPPAPLPPSPSPTGRQLY